MRQRQVQLTNKDHTMRAAITFTISACVTLLSASVAFAVEVAELPWAKFADTEVSTNFTFAVGAVANRRLVFTLELQASPFNNVEVPAPPRQPDEGPPRTRAEGVGTAS